MGVELKNRLMDYKVLFSDLDNTLIETKSGEEFPTDINDWKFKYDVIENIYKMNIERLHIVTNQGGIEKGYFSRGEIIKKLKRVCADIQTFTNKGYCPFMISFDFSESERKSDRKRKPNTGMFEDFFKVYGNRYTKEDCLMLGDASGKHNDFSDSDKVAAKNFGIDYMDVNDFIK